MSEHKRGPIQQDIHDTLVAGLAPSHLQVINESVNHNVPPGSESHFKLVVVADCFNGKRLIQRHREVNALLKPYLDGPVHAISMHTHTAEEWVSKGEVVPDSPPCRGGS